MKRTNTRTDKEQIPLLSLSLRYNFNRHTASFWHTASGTQPPFGTQPPSFFLYEAIGTQPFLLLGTQPFSPSRHTASHSLAMHPPSRRPLSAFRCPAAAVAAPRPQLLRIALIDRPSHACTDMTHYIQVRCVSQARNAFRCNGQVQNEARRPGMGKSIPKGRLCQRGKGPYLTTFHLPLLNPLPLLKYSHPLPMPCHSSFHP